MSLTFVTNVIEVCMRTCMLEQEYSLVLGVVIIPLQIATKWSMIKSGLKWVVQCRKQKQFKILQCFTIIWKNELDL